MFRGIHPRSNRRLDLGVFLGNSDQSLVHQLRRYGGLGSGRRSFQSYRYSRSYTMGCSSASESIKIEWTLGRFPAILQGVKTSTTFLEMESHYKYASSITSLITLTHHVMNIPENLTFFTESKGIHYFLIFPETSGTPLRKPRS